MIESIFSTQTTNTAQTQRVLTYVKNERMGGFVPKYETRPIEQNNISQNIETSMLGAQGQDSLTYQASQSATTAAEDQFGFSDLLDMVNPLQHIPIIGHIYRELTGDEIKPISKIVGGAAFSGPIGLASALIDTVVTNETGTDMASNAYNLAFNQNSTATSPQPGTPSQSPEKSIETAINALDDPDMTRALLSFSNLGAEDISTLRYEASQRAEVAINTATPEQRAPITTLSVSGKGGLYAL